MKNYYVYARETFFFLSTIVYKMALLSKLAIKDEILRKVYLRTICYMCPRDIDIMYGHARCPDGIGAMAVHKYANFKNGWNHPTTYIEFDYRQSKVDMEMVRGKNVCWVDCHPGRAVLEAMKEVCNTLLVIDHHKGAADELESLDWVVICEDLCAMQMAWVFCMGYAEPMSLFIDYIYARDMWKWKEVPDSEIISAGINMMRLDIDNYALFLELSDERFIEFWKILGSSKYEKDQEKARAMTKNKEIWEVLVPNAEMPMSQEDSDVEVVEGELDQRYVKEEVAYVHTNRMVSDVGNMLVKEPSVKLAILTYYKAPSDQNPQPDIGLSFRSEEGKRSAMKMAQLFGGNGHECSAGGNSILGLTRTIWADHFPDDAKLEHIGSKDGLNEKTLRLLRQSLIDNLYSGSVYNIPFAADP